MHSTLQLPCHKTLVNEAFFYQEETLVRLLCCSSFYLVNLYALLLQERFCLMCFCNIFLPCSIVIRSERITLTNGTQPTDVTFPQEVDLENFTISSGLSPAVITIPAQLIVERSNCKCQPIEFEFTLHFLVFIPSKYCGSSPYPVSESARLSTTRIEQVRLQ